jgi:hypothetical protein
MSHSYAQNVIHVVFSTKDRRKTISAEFQPRLWSYSAGICKKQGIFVHAIGRVPHPSLLRVRGFDFALFLFALPPSAGANRSRGLVVFLRD